MIDWPVVGIIFSILLSLGSLVLAILKSPSEIKGKQAEVNATNLNMALQALSDREKLIERIEKLEKIQKSKIVLEVHLQTGDPLTVLSSSARYVELELEKEDAST